MSPARGEPLATPEAAPTGPAKTPRDEKAERLAAFNRVLNETSADERRRGFLELLTSLQAADAAEVHDLLERLKNSGRDVGFELEALNRRWGALDPLGALAKLDAKPADKRSKDEYEQVLFGWAAKDYHAAQAWLNANNGHPQYDQAFLGYVAGHASRNLGEATRGVLNSLKSDDPLLAPALSRLAMSARNESLNTMKAWYDQLPTDEASLAAKKLAAHEVYRLLPTERYAQNADWVATQINTPWRNNAMIANFARNYADAFPKAAMNWIQNTEPSPDKGIIIGVGEVVRAWEKRSLKDLQLWLEQNSTSPVFQQAAHDLAISQAGKNPEVAKYWADKITAPTYRQQAQAALQKPQLPR